MREEKKEDYKRGKVKRDNGRHRGKGEGKHLRERFRVQGKVDCLMKVRNCSFLLS